MQIMSEVVIERALYRRERGETPRLLASSPGLAEELYSSLADVLDAYGERPAGASCPGAIFAQPLGNGHVVVVQVNDGPPGPSGWASLLYSAMVLTRRD